MTDKNSVVSTFIAGHLTYAKNPPAPGTVLGPDAKGEMLVVARHKELVDGRTRVSLRYATTDEIQESDVVSRELAPRAEPVTATPGVPAMHYGVHFARKRAS